ADLPIDGGVTIDWASARDDRRLDEAVTWLARTLESKRLKIGGEALPNPMWRLLPPALAEVLGSRRGPLLSVHPLGGCRLGDDRRRGVVNGLGEVFDGEGESDTAVHPGLLVLDGAIVPTSLGINPSLTIATLASFAIRRVARRWGWQRLPNAAMP